jgi:tripartite-type tricarboxylate transporter receptor subunit TctC
MTPRLMLRLTVALLCCIALHRVGAAEEAYPSHSIRFVVPFTPGGGTDFMARLIGLKLTEKLGQTVIVDNKPGAGGIIGTDAVAKAPPDGYTLLLGSVSTISINPGLYASLPFDTVKDLTPVSMFAITPALLVVPASLPPNSVQELIALAKARPGQLNFASAGTGTSHQLAGELFKYMAGVDLVHVPYKGSAPGVTALLGGEVQMMFADVPAVLAQVQAKNLKALGVTGLKRSTLLPDLPTVAEQGLPGFEMLVWYGVLAPAGVPQPIVQKLNETIRAAAADPDVREKLAAHGAEPAAGPSAEFAALIQAEIAKWARVIKMAGVKVE